MSQELPIHFDCGGATLHGVLHRPDAAGARGVVLVVGGPQYRVGSHRQFVLLARVLADAGIAVLRFDYRGMGDSDGEAHTFEAIAADIRAAIDELQRSMPTIREVVLWGLCDAASAALQYAPSDRRVCGLVLLNPWVRTEQGLARTYLKQYYGRRLLDPNLWRRLRKGEFSVVTALRSLWGDIRRSRSGGREGAARAQTAALPLPQRMLQGWQQFSGRVLLVLSGDDITAGEFKNLIAGSAAWRRVLAAPGVERRDLAGANHTFATRAWRDQVATWTRDWLRSW